jgi:hypothetical protein
MDPRLTPGAFGLPPTSSFPATSRYANLIPLTLEGPDGKLLVYLPRRFIAAPESLQTLAEHRVAQGERLDNLAGAFFGDPEQFFRLCDANRAMRPVELTETPGRTLRITLPQGVLGPVL